MCASGMGSSAQFARLRQTHVDRPDCVAVNLSEGSKGRQG